MNSMNWPGSRVSGGKVIIHPADPRVLCLMRRVERISREDRPKILNKFFQLVSGDKELLVLQDG